MLENLLCELICEISSDDFEIIFIGHLSIELRQFKHF